MALKSTTGQGSTELLPPEGDKDVGKTVMQLIEQIISDKINIGLHDRWLYYYRLGRNQHWRDASKKLSLTSPNLLFTHRQRTINMMTANNPTFNVKRIGPINPDQEEKVNVLLHLSEEWWIENEIQHIMEQAVHNGETYGATVGYVPYDPEANGGDGDVTPFVIDNFQFGWWPIDVPFERAEACFYFRPMTVREAWRKWPKMRDKIVPDAQWMDDLGRERREIQGGKQGSATGWKSVISGVTYLVNQIARRLGKGVDSDELLVVSCWVKDYTAVPVMRKKPVRDDQGRLMTAASETEEPTEENEYKYPGKIRYVVTCNGGDVVMEDRRNPSINWNLPIDLAEKTYLFNRFPFTVTHSITDPSSPWGTTDFEQGSPMQIELDKSLSQFGVWKDFTLTRQKLINPQNSGVDDAELSNAPGIIHPANTEMAKVFASGGYMQSPSAPKEILQAIELYKDFFMLVMGTWDFDRAQKQAGGDQLAYKTLQALIEIASMMAQGKIRNYSRMDREWGRMYVSHAQNWFIDKDRVYTTIQDENGQDKSVAVFGPELILPIKLSVVSGSTMPVSRVQEREQAIALHEKGLVDQDYVLTELDVSGKDQIMKRMQQGPLSAVLDMLRKIGAPPPLLDIIQQLSMSDPKKVDQAIEKGAIPPFQAIMQTIMGQQGPAEAPPEDPVQTAEAGLKEAQAQKQLAEIKLIEEKIITERVLQYVKATGVQLDKEQLSMERARIVNEMGRNRNQDLANIRKTAIEEKKVDFAAKKTQGPYREKGMESNNDIGERE